MSQIDTIKAKVSPADAGRHYGLKISRSGMVHCPFHNDTNPSMKLYDDHFYCFACGAHGDVIDLTAKLLGMNFTEAVRRLAADFGIGPNNDPPMGSFPKDRTYVMPEQIEQGIINQALMRMKIFTPYTFRISWSSLILC